MTNEHLQIITKKLLSYKPNFDLEILDIGLKKFQVSEFKAGDCILKAGEICQNIFLVENSITRCYFQNADGDEKTIWLEPEMTFITDYESFSSQAMSRCDICCYEDSSVYFIDATSLLMLYEEHHEWAILGILIIEEHFVNVLKFRNTISFNNASENYDLVECYFSRYFDVVPLKHLASWLNISAVHLSRIRKERIKLL